MDAFIDDAFIDKDEYCDLHPKTSTCKAWWKDLGSEAYGQETVRSNSIQAQLS